MKVIERLNEKFYRKKNHKNFYVSNHILQVHKTYVNKNLNIDNVCWHFYIDFTYMSCWIQNLFNSCIH